MPLNTRIFALLIAFGMTHAALAQNSALLTTFTSPNPATNSFGFSLAVVGSDAVIIGAWGDDTGEVDAGAAYLFSVNGTLVTTFTNVTPAVGDRFGFAVAAMGSDRVLVGAPRDDTSALDAGAAYLFNTNGTLLNTFTNPALGERDNFGAPITSFGEDRLLIGRKTPEFGPASTTPGSVYLFSTNGTLLSTFNNPTPNVSDHFGSTIAAVGIDLVLICSAAADSGEIQAGVAYLFRTNGTLLTTITNPASSSHKFFGASAAAMGSDRLLIGASVERYLNTISGGVAYLFSTNGMLFATFSNPTPANGGRFGSAVEALGGNQVLIGAAAESLVANQAGAAFLFNTNGTLLCSFTKPSPESLEFFGWSIAAMGSDRVVIGAYGAHVSPSALGAAYLYGLPPPAIAISPTAPGDTSISWTPELPGFVLQETEALSPANWTNSPSGAANPIIVPLAPPSKYFRLKKP